MRVAARAVSRRFGQVRALDAVGVHQTLRALPVIVPFVFALTIPTVVFLLDDGLRALAGGVALPLVSWTAARTWVRGADESVVD